jgi:hypothetical protein
MTHRRSRPKKTPPQIFAPGGESLQFYIYPLTEQKQTIQKLIEDHGGKVERRKTEGVIALGDMHSVSQAATSSVFSIDFVHDSIEAGHLKDLNLYRLSETVLDHDSLSLPVRRSKRSFSDANLSSSQPVKRKRLPFTEEDDKAIIEWVKSHPETEPGSLLLWKKAAKEKITAHPATSMYTRYYVLRKRLKDIDIAQSQSKENNKSKKRNEGTEGSTNREDDGQGSSRNSENDANSDEENASQHVKNIQENESLQLQTQETSVSQRHFSSEEPQPVAQTVDNNLSHSHTSTHRSDQRADSSQQQTVTSLQGQDVSKREVGRHKQSEKKRKSFADIIREQKDPKRQRTTTSVRYEPKTKRERLVQDLVKRLIDETGYPGKVVLYALLAYSGNYFSAREFLLNKGDVSKCESKPWTREEDEAILQKKDTLRIVQQRGADATAERAEFLQSIVDESYAF